MSPLRRGDGPAMRFRCGKANLCLHAPDAGSGTYNHRARDARAEFKRYRIFRAGVKATTEVPGRGRGARTPDLRFWRPPLYQLSYTPVSVRRFLQHAPRDFKRVFRFCPRLGENSARQGRCLPERRWKSRSRHENAGQSSPFENLVNLDDIAFRIVEEDLVPGARGHASGRGHPRILLVGSPATFPPHPAKSS